MRGRELRSLRSRSWLCKSMIECVSPEFLEGRADAMFPSVMRDDEINVAR
jgi:hypothetical protein